MNIDPTTTKYVVKAELNAEGVVEKPDVIGAIFGQTEGLLGEDLDLRDLQKSGRIGRIEVNVQSKKGRSSGNIVLPSSLDKVETAIIASAMETIDRVGPCKAGIKITAIEDVRISKRKLVADRAKELLAGMVEGSKGESFDLIADVKDAVRVEEMINFKGLPAGPNVATSDAILIVEGRNDVALLLTHGIKNAVACEGTNVPDAIKEISKDKVATALVDGDRGGELLLKELLQTCDIDFVARAPKNSEVEELTQKGIMKALRNKMPAEQYIEQYGISDEQRGRPAAPDEVAQRPDRPMERREERRDERRGGERPMERHEERRGGDRPTERHDERRGDRRDDRSRGRDRGRDRHGRGRERHERREGGPRREEPVYQPEPDEEPAPVGEGVEPDIDADAVDAFAASPHAEFIEAGAPGAPAGSMRAELERLSGKLQGVLMDRSGAVMGDPIAVRDLADTLKKQGEGVDTVVFDGVVTQRLLDIALEKKISTLVGVKLGNITKQPSEVRVLTRDDL